MAKICITMAFICFTLSVLPNLSNSRYLLVELEPIDALEPKTLPEDDEKGVMPEQEQEPTHVGSRISGNLEDQCRHTECGVNTGCRIKNNRAECVCLPQHTGNPYKRCIPDENVVKG